MSPRRAAAALRRRLARAPGARRRGRPRIERAAAVGLNYDAEVAQDIKRLAPKHAWLTNPKVAERRGRPYCSAVVACLVDEEFPDLQPEVVEASARTAASRACERVALRHPEPRIQPASVSSVVQAGRSRSTFEVQESEEDEPLMTLVDESGYTDRVEGDRRGPPASAATCAIARSSSASSSSSDVAAAVAQTRDALERGMREWVEVEDDEQRLHLLDHAEQRTRRWCTGLRGPPFHCATSLGHDGHGDGHDFMHSKCPCTHQCVGAVKPCSSRNSTAMLERRSARAPLEFTFMRDGRATRLGGGPAAVVPHVEPRRHRQVAPRSLDVALGSAEVVEVARARRSPAPRVPLPISPTCSRSATPMASGYSFAGNQQRSRCRLRFVGRVEQSSPTQVDQAVLVEIRCAASAIVEFCASSSNRASVCRVQRLRQRLEAAIRRPQRRGAPT